jgi:hypothetical protein
MTKETVSVHAQPANHTTKSMVDVCAQLDKLIMPKEDSAHAPLVNHTINSTESVYAHQDRAMTTEVEDVCAQLARLMMLDKDFASAQVVNPMIK